MNAHAALLALLAFGPAPLVLAQAPGRLAPPSPPVAQALPRATTPEPGLSTQRVYGPASDTLIARHTAEGILEGFRRVYNVNDHAPRVVIY
ncbi:MAG: hypothetical protein RIQ93_3228, partial [Verrucomicrobiota bacterium]